jgi:hypothetical protein
MKLLSYTPKKRRFRKTLNFLSRSVLNSKHILDLGTRNEFSKLLEDAGYKVTNTIGEDLDENLELICKVQADCTTAFEIFEHLLNPLGVLRAIKSEKLIASIPLRLWFAKAYRNKNDRWDQHFHEFEDWQFDWLLEKAGWKIIRREKWTSPVLQIGFRPMLRLFYPRYYIIEAVRISKSKN